MPFFFAGLSSVTFGVADFVGGFATKRTPAVTVVAGSHLVALVGIVAIAPLFGAGVPGAAEWAWGAAGGVAGAVGLAVFYHALATTRMGVVAPMAALVSTAVPVLFGLAIGERPELLAWLGMMIAIPAAVLLSGGGPRGRGDGIRAALLGMLAGAMFGLFAVLISRTGAASGMWPLVSARVASLLFMASVALALGKRVTPERSQWGIVATAGVLDMAANAFFLLAVREELLSLVVVIQSFYPAATIVLARAVLGERMTRNQLLGIGCAAVAVVLIAGA